MKTKNVVFLLFIWASTNAQFSASSFNSSLIQRLSGTVLYADFNNDGYSDLFIMGYTDGWPSFDTKIYQNNSGSFSTTTMGNFTGVGDGKACVGDYNNDGKIDLLISGSTSVPPSGLTRLYRNEGSGSFSTINTNLPNLYNGSVEFGDYDNDGDQDIAIIGDDGSSKYARVYRNDNLTFNNIGASLTGISYGCVKWGDYDNDGDLDLLTTGDDGTSRQTKLYRNDNNSFVNSGFSFTALKFSWTSWGDYDSDGDLDFIITGYNSSNAGTTKIYRNERSTNSWTDMPSIGIANFYSGEVAWGDYDNDGDFDIAATGKNTQSIYYSKIYRNNGNNTFTSVYDMTANGGWSSIAWGDYNNDNKLDVINLGLTTAGTAYTKAYYNTGSTANTAPSAPSNLSTSINGSDITLSWNKSSDNQTTQNGLTYNIYVKESNNLKLSPLADLVNGNRRIFQTGNVGHKTTFTVKNLPIGNSYEIGVQAIDNSFKGSTFSTATVDNYFSRQYTVDSLLGAFQKWFDSDNDGDIDLLIFNSSNSYLYLNTTGNYFYKTNTNIEGASDCKDFDMDGDIDVMYNTSIYRNDGSNNFNEVTTNLPSNGTLNSWVDFDNDGDYDISLTSSNNLKIYRNDGNNNYVDLGVTISRLTFSQIRWVDYDNDKDYDLYLDGYTSVSPTYIGLSAIYRNDNGSLIETNSNLQSYDYGASDWGDYDNDGDLDLVTCGYNYPNDQAYTKIYRNDNGSMINVVFPTIENADGNCSWGDFNNDGKLDLLICGRNSSSNCITKVYKNTGSDFVNIDNSFDTYSYTGGSWVDYDNDGDLDLSFSGRCFSCGTLVYNTQIYKNNSIISNFSPSSPANLTSTNNSGTITLSWTKSTDSQTPQNGLSYNIYLRSSGGTYYCPSNSNNSNGFRKIVGIGNTCQNNSWIIKNLPAGTYYWSVQSIDNGFKASAFASEASFTK